MISTKNLRRFVKESFEIERIDLTEDQETAQSQYAAIFLGLSQITVHEVLGLLNLIEPTAQLRDKPGLNVRIGNRRAPSGGPEIRTRLEYLLEEQRVSPRRWHIEFEHLHPFTDGNGRVGRMIWLWQMMNQHGYDGELGFLHMWYYQSFGD